MKDQLNFEGQARLEVFERVESLYGLGRQVRILRSLKEHSHGILSYFEYRQNCC